MAHILDRLLNELNEIEAGEKVTIKILRADPNAIDALLQAINLRIYNIKKSINPNQLYELPISQLPVQRRKSNRPNRQSTSKMSYIPKNYE